LPGLDGKPTSGSSNSAGKIKEVGNRPPGNDANEQSAAALVGSASLGSKVGARRL
jgi:hypothetical protein